jgi:hypothetical protein
MSKAKRKKDATPAGGSADVAAETSVPALSKKERKAAEKAAAKEAKAAEREARKLAKKAAKEKPSKPEEHAEKGADHAERAKPSTEASTPKFKHVRRKKLSSGKGATAQEIGASLVALFNAGKSDEAEQTWYHRRIESIEEDGTVFEGWKGVLEKGKWWKETFTVLSMRASGPYVCANGFTVVFTGRVRLPDGSEVEAHECGVYTVEKGRIVREQFMQWRG